MINTTFYPTSGFNGYESLLEAFEAIDRSEKADEFDGIDDFNNFGKVSNIDIEDDNDFSEFDDVKPESKRISNYPSYNIFYEGEDDLGVIEVACVGLDADDLDVYLEEGNLVVEASGIEKEDRQYTHKGLSYGRKFKRKFKLEKNNQVDTVTINNGLMRITLKIVEPERHFIPINLSEMSSLPSEAA